MIQAESPECPDCCRSAAAARSEHTWGSDRIFAEYGTLERIRSTHGTHGTLVKHGAFCAMRVGQRHLMSSQPNQAQQRRSRQGPEFYSSSGSLRCASSPARCGNNAASANRVSPCPSYKPTCQCAHVPRRDEALKIRTGRLSPTARIGNTYEVNGPRSQYMPGVAGGIRRRLGRPITHVDVPFDQCVTKK